MTNSENKPGTYQFIHLDAYARVGSSQTKTITKGNKKHTTTTTKRNIKEILDEAMREKNSCPHVKNPQKPKILFGVNPLEVEQISEDWAAQNKDAKGRKMRKDGLCMVAGVASLPNSMIEEFDSFADDVVVWLKNKYGERLKSVVSHLDEAHPHLHFFVVPNHGEKFDQIHEGYKARNEMRAKNEIGKMQNLAYIEAMRSFQNDFNDKVGVKNGLLRLGPARRRLTRKQWHDEQTQASNIRRKHKKIKNRQSQLDKIEKEQKRKRKELDEEIAEKKSLGGMIGLIFTGAKEQLDAPKLKEENEKYKSQAEQKTKTIATLERQNTELERNNAQLDRDNIDLEEEKNRYKKQVEENITTIATLENKLSYKEDLIKRSTLKLKGIINKASVSNPQIPKNI